MAYYAVNKYMPSKPGIFFRDQQFLFQFLRKRWREERGRHAEKWHQSNPVIGQTLWRGQGACRDIPSASNCARMVRILSKLSGVPGSIITR